MKKFILLQIVIIFTGFLVCSSLKKEQPNSSYMEIKNYRDILDIDASVYMIPEEDAWLDQSAKTYIDFFEELYATNKTKIFDKQILIIEPNETISVYNDCIFQDVKVISVIDGEKNFSGNNFRFIYPAGFKIESRKEYQNRVNNERLFGIETSQQYSDKPVLNLAGLNIMKPGHKYFIFAQSLNLSKDYTILCADRQQYTWMDLTINSSKAMTENSFKKYYNNEIFTDSQVVIDDYYRLKEEVFNYYNIKN